jgi:hypothetical protein
MAMNTDEFDFIWVWLDRVQKPLQFLIAYPEFGRFISRGNIWMYLLKKGSFLQKMSKHCYFAYQGILYRCELQNFSNI